VHSEWHAADGNNLIQSNGEPLSVYEYWLRSALLSPLPAAADLDPATSILVDHSIASPGAHSRCIMVVPSAIKEQDARALPFGTYPEYCVNKGRPLLLGYNFFGPLQIKCVNFTSLQGKSMPREIYITAETRQMLSAKAEPAEAIDSTDRALMPPADAIRVNPDKAQIGPEAAGALVVKKVAPTAPDDAKIGADQRKVFLQVTIGIDGAIEDVRLVSAQTPSLALPAFLSVSHWKFKRKGGRRSWRFDWILDSSHKQSLCDDLSRQTRGQHRASSASVPKLPNAISIGFSVILRVDCFPNAPIAISFAASRVCRLSSTFGRLCNLSRICALAAGIIGQLRCPLQRHGLLSGPFWLT
jgi:hypothetical protein